MAQNDQILNPTDDAAVAHQMGMRVAQWLKEQWPHDTAKLAARELDASPNTVRNWLSGQFPSVRHWAAMCRRGGKALVAKVMEPAVGGWPSYSLEQEMTDLRARIDRMQEALRNESAGLVHEGDAGRVLPYRAPVHEMGRIVAGQASARRRGSSRPARA